MIEFTEDDTEQLEILQTRLDEVQAERDELLEALTDLVVESHFGVERRRAARERAEAAIAKAEGK
jgi:hypothetical protein